MDAHPRISLSHRPFVRLWRDERGQDMIEYALMAAMVAIAVAAFVPYSMIPAVSHIYSRLQGVMSSLVPN